MKLPMQVAPIQRNFGSARYAISSGIKPSENLCSCNFKFLACVVNWDNCPSGYHAQCTQGINGCWCHCCTAGGKCFGDYP
jgi:hypothetical protein